MYYRKLTALALFICAAIAAPPTAASKRDTVKPKDDTFPVTCLSSTAGGFSAASKGAHECDVIDRFTGAFGDPQVQSIEEDGTIGVMYPVIQ